VRHSRALLTRIRSIYRRSDGWSDLARWRADRERRTEALKSLDIALHLDIAYMHGTDKGKDKGVDSGAFKERFKASFKVAPVLVVNWLY
jgi:hypothetical protein